MTHYYLGMIIALAWVIDNLIDDADTKRGMANPNSGKVEAAGVIVSLLLVLVWPVLVLGTFANAIGLVWDRSQGRERP